MLSAPLPCAAWSAEACVSAGEVPLLQRSQAQSQAAWEVPAVLGVGQAQVGAGLPGFSLSALLEGDQAPCPPCHPVSQGSVNSRCWYIYVERWAFLEGGLIFLDKTGTHQAMGQV